MKFYTINVLGIKRDLPIIKAPSGIYIAGFNPVGDMELLSKAGKYLSKLILQQNINFDVILTTELKGLPLLKKLPEI